MRGWAKNQSGLYKVEIERHTKLINELDLKLSLTFLMCQIRLLRARLSRNCELFLEKKR